MKSNKKALKKKLIIWHTRRAVEAGLVERTMLPDDPVDDQDPNTRYRVDHGYEWTMSPAITLMCVSTLAPWISGVHDAPYHFELLVATIMVAIRYRQTGKEFPVIQLEKPVPYGKCQSTLYYPKNTKDFCLVNAPLAPYSDLMISEVDEVIQPRPSDTLSRYLRELADECHITKSPILVQCKLTGVEKAGLSLINEYARMGFVFKDSGRSSPDPSSDAFQSFTDTMKKQYHSGYWPTQKCFEGGESFVMFATNAKFERSDLMVESDLLYMVEGLCGNDYAWKCFYPFNQLVRLPGAFSPHTMQVIEADKEEQQ